jgi:putative restriction endonuclease
LHKYPLFQQASEEVVDFGIQEAQTPQYGSVLTKVRIGQGAFRVGVIEAYHRRCSLTGEKTLPVLEAAHIQPYSYSGINSVSNGILMRSDIHKLFDSGYVTVTPEYTIEISRKIKEEFENGREYYQHHGKSLLYLPDNEFERPSPLKLEWHNNNIFKG